MLNDPQRDYLKSVILPMQMIVGALAAGVLSFAVVLMIINPGQADAVELDPLTLSLIAAGVAAVAIVMSFLVPMLLAGAARQTIVDGKASSTLPQPSNPEAVGDVAPLAGMFLTRLIIGAALLEGAAFFNLVAFWIERQIYSLALAGVILVLILLRIPTLAGLTDWCARELKETQLLRQMQQK
jgi:hypothetical protein